MQKHLIILIIYIVCTLGCAKSWTNKEKNDFINDCMIMGGSEITCVCILSCLEKEYITYNEALRLIEKIELKKECKACLEKCEQLIY